MTKYSISLTDELAKEISDRYPDSKFSTAIAKLVRKGLDVDTANPANPTNTTNSPNPTLVPTSPSPIDIANMVRELVQEELRNHIPPAPIPVSEPVIVSNPVVVQDPIIHESDNDWLTNSEVVSLLPESLPRGTKSARVSRAISSGKLKSNGKSGTRCRIRRIDAIAWVQAQ